MKLADVCIRRPVFAGMMSLAIITLGAFSYRTLGVDLMPAADAPNVNVQMRLPGASAEEVESQVTKIVEQELNSLASIDEMKTTSSQGNSQTNLVFVLEKPIDSAVQDVRDRMQQTVGEVPKETEAAKVTKTDSNAGASITIAMSSDRDLKELTDIADKQVKQVLETIDGVAEINFSGERRRQVQLLLNADRMNAYGITVDQVRQAINRQDIEIPGGTFNAGPSEVALRTMGRMQQVSDYNKIILSQRDGSTVTFADIGRVVDTVEEPKSFTRVDGKNAVTLGIRRQNDSNTIAVIDRVLARLETIKKTLPPDIQFSIRGDQSVFIRSSIDQIKEHLLLGSILAALVVFFFLRNARSTLIAALAIPVSLIGTFAVMKLFHMTLNNMTLLALSLATGIVIDDAIVVLENIFRYVEEKGVTPQEAASKATAEIGTAVLATTLSLVVIFLPVIFITGQIGQYLLAFGIASASAILLSMFVSFTLTPALCSVFLRTHDASHGGTKSKSKGVYASIDRAYGSMLRWSLHHRVTMVFIAVIVTLSVILLLPRIGKELVPDDDQSQFNVNFNLPKGTSVTRTAEYFQDAEGILRKMPAVKTVFTQINAASAGYFIELVPLDQRKVTQQDVMRQARNILRARYPGVRMGVSGGTDLSGAATGGNGGNRLSVIIQGPDIGQLETYTTQLMDKLRTIPKFVDVSTNFEPTQPELRVQVDRIRAADLGINIDSLASNLRTLVGGDKVSTMKDGDDAYDVILRLDEEFRRDPTKMGNLLIPAGTQRSARVSDVAQLTMANGPATINRYNRQRQITINANLDNVPLGDAVNLATEKVKELDMKVGYQTVFTGNAKTLATASNDFTLAMFLAVAFIYMVLASQFNSLIHPLTIMTALPLSLPAGLLALMLCGMTLNVYSAIGLLMLFGIVKKNSILQVDYTNTLRSQGMERHEALIAANHVRLRPILMTTIAVIAGMFPIAIGRGAGAGSRASMAITIIGGQMLCLMLTLLITPVAYSLFDDLREWSPSRLWSWRRKATPETGVAGD